MLKLRTWVKLELHPFKILLYLEWILLIISLINPIFIEIIDPPTLMETTEGSKLFEAIFFLPWSFWGYTIAFGILGLRLPSKDTWNKILYTALEFILVILACHSLFWYHISFVPLLIIAIRSCLIFSRTGQLVVAGIILIIFTSNIFLFDWAVDENISITFSKNDFLNIESLSSIISDLEIVSQKSDTVFLLKFQLQNIFLFVLTLVFNYLLINTLISERLNRRKLAHAHAQLYEYSAKIEDQATLQERNRIAREIHDSLGHLLTAQSIQLDNGLLLIKSDLDRAETFFQTSKEIANDALKELRHSVNTLRAAPLQDQSLERKIINLVENYQQITGIAIDYKIDIHLPISSDIAIAIFRIIEEALTNIYKHSSATKARVFLQTESSDNNASKLWFKIEDDGLGFSVEQNTMGFGLKSMCERTVDLGGNFKIVSQVGKGCQVLGSFSLRGV